MEMAEIETQEISLASFQVAEQVDQYTDHELSGTRVILEPVSNDPYELSFACLIIPRFATHLLIGDLADELRHLMKRICLSFNWRLEYLSIQPGYLQWVLHVPPNTSPADFMPTIRGETSKVIFEDHPPLKRENLSKDFWAPGYLVIVSTRPHPLEMVNEYIQLTRQQQGIPPRQRG
jgi:REP element-mobilizing transposase RayT